MGDHEYRNTRRRRVEAEEEEDPYEATGSRWASSPQYSRIAQQYAGQQSQYPMRPDPRDVGYRDPHPYPNVQDPRLPQSAGGDPSHWPGVSSRTGHPYQTPAANYPQDHPYPAPREIRGEPSRQQRGSRSDQSREVRRVSAAGDDVSVPGMSEEDLTNFRIGCNPILHEVERSPVGTKSGIPRYWKQSNSSCWLSQGYLVRFQPSGC